MDRKKILVVDDEEEIVKLVAKRLKGAGFDVITAGLGRQAVMKAVENPPDLILMDIMLPDIEGSDAVNLLNEHESTRIIPIIFLSGIINKEEGSPGTEIKVAGRMYPAIGKPFTFEELLTLVKKMII